MVKNVQPAPTSRFHSIGQLLRTLPHGPALEQQLLAGQPQPMAANESSGTTRCPFRLGIVIHEEREPIPDAEKLPTLQFRLCVARQMVIHYPHRHMPQFYGCGVGIDRQSDL